nr:11861_t:CDS:2 [Entrophospora candida]
MNIEKGSTLVDVEMREIFRAAAEKPEKYELDDKEFERISKFPEFKPELVKKIDNESKAM